MKIPLNINDPRRIRPLKDRLAPAKHAVDHQYGRTRCQLQTHVDPFFSSVDASAKRIRVALTPKTVQHIQHSKVTIGQFSIYYILLL